MSKGSPAKEPGNVQSIRKRRESAKANKGRNDLGHELGPYFMASAKEGTGVNSRLTGNYLGFMKRE